MWNTARADQLQRILKRRKIWMLQPALVRTRSLLQTQTAPPRPISPAIKRMNIRLSRKTIKIIPLLAMARRPAPALLTALSQLPLAPIA